MRIKQVHLKKFKRFDDLTIDLGPEPKKIIALVGPNGCGKSSVFDAFEEMLKKFRIRNSEEASFFSKSFFYKDAALKNEIYDRNEAIQIQTLNDTVLEVKSFYIRTAYRFSSKLNVSSITRIDAIGNTGDEPISSIALDIRLENNYRRLLSQAFQEFDHIGTKTGNQIKEELIGEINNILKNVLAFHISSLGNVISGRGQLYFEKENVTNFPYANLSAGEKEVVDIIIDLVIKVHHYNDTVYCIDEPELHLNTSIQRKLLIEIEKLIPSTCQLWSPLIASVF